EQTQSECNLRLSREHGMTGDENQAEQVVTYIVVESRLQVFHHDLCRAHRESIQFTAELFVLALEPRLPAKIVNRAMLGRGHQPCAWIVRHARLWPLLKRSDQRIL